MGGWAAGGGSQGVQGTLFQGNVSHRNCGEGLLACAGPGGTVFRDNVVYDNWSVNIYVDNQPDALIENNFIYSHQPDLQDLYNNGDEDPSDGSNLMRLRPESILTADEDYGLDPPANLSNVIIRNNVIVNCRTGIGHYGQAEGSGLKNVKVYHNTIVIANDRLEGEGVQSAIRVPYNDGNNSGTEYRDNLVYATNPEAYLLYGDTSSADATEQFAGVALGFNLWYHTSRPGPFHWGFDWDTAYDFAHDEWLALPGSPHGEGDVYADPGLADPSSLDASGMQPGDAGSPAVDAGADAGVTIDFNHCPRPSGPGFDLGAFELQ